MHCRGPPSNLPVSEAQRTVAAIKEGLMKKKTPQNHRVSTSELLRQLSPAEFEELNHNLDVRIRRYWMRASVINGGKSKSGKEVRHEES
jgi:hypothetical protein